MNLGAMPDAEGQHSFYHRLNHQTLWIRWNGAQEGGFGVVTNPVLAILRNRPVDPRAAAAIERLQDDYIRLYALSLQPRSRMTTASEGLEAAASSILASAPTVDRAVFNGYSFDPDAEGVAAREALASFLAGRGLQILISDRRAAASWLSKPAFCKRAAAIYGAGATPPGLTLWEPAAAELLSVAERTLKDLGARIVLKRNGCGGVGNLLLSPGDALVERIRTFLLSPLSPAASWVRVEHWLEWESSYCCSFFLDSESAPYPVALTQQIISPSHALQIGSRSFLDLDDRDTAAMIDCLRPIMSCMQTDGIRGFTAVDLIVSRPGAWSEGLRLPSGRGLRLVECNPRINRHN